MGFETTTFVSTDSRDTGQLVRESNLGFKLYIHCYNKELLFIVINYVSNGTFTCKSLFFRKRLDFVTEIHNRI